MFLFAWSESIFIKQLDIYHKNVIITWAKYKGYQLMWWKIIVFTVYTINKQIENNTIQLHSKQRFPPNL